MVLEVGLGGADADHLGHAGAVDAALLGQEAIALVALTPGVVALWAGQGVRQPGHGDVLGRRSRRVTGFRNIGCVGRRVVQVERRRRRRARITVGQGVRRLERVKGAPGGFAATGTAKRTDANATVSSENRIRRRWVGIRVESLNALSLGTWSTRWHHRRRHSRTPAGPRCLGPPGGSSARRSASPTLHCPPSRHGAMGRSRWVFTRWPSPVSPSDVRARPVTSPPSNGRS